MLKWKVLILYIRWGGVFDIIILLNIKDNIETLSIFSIKAAIQNIEFPGLIELAIIIIYIQRAIRKENFLSLKQLYMDDDIKSNENALIDISKTG